MSPRLLSQNPKAPLSEVYALSCTARRRFTEEATRADRDFRLIVGHASLLDELTLHFTNTGQTDDSRSSQTAKNAPIKCEAAIHIQGADQTLVVERAAGEEMDDDIDDDKTECSLASISTAPHSLPELLYEDLDSGVKDASKSLLTS